jgi:hypothetical protein
MASSQKEGLLVVALDSGSYFRLKAAIDATLLGLGSDSTAAKAAADAYATFRAEAERLAADARVVEEFKRMFPIQGEVPRPALSRGYDPIAAESAARESISLLTRLSGWLDGFSRQVQSEAEAQAYADRRERNL